MLAVRATCNVKGHKQYKDAEVGLNKARTTWNKTNSKKPSSIRILQCTTTCNICCVKCAVSELSKVWVTHNELKTKRGFFKVRATHNSIKCFASKDPAEICKIWWLEDRIKYLWPILIKSLIYCSVIKHCRLHYRE